MVVPPISRPGAGQGGDVRHPGGRALVVLAGVAIVGLLGACEVGSTDVAGGATAAAKTPPTRADRRGDRADGRDRPHRNRGPRGDVEWNLGLHAVARRRDLLDGDQPDGG